MRGRGEALTLVAVALATGCSASALPASLVRAESLEADHRDDEALRAYDDALAGCTPSRPPLQTMGTPSPRDCGRAALERADLLYDLDRFQDAAHAYDEAATLPPASLVDARALEREAETFADHLGDTDRAVDLAWRVVDGHPDATSATESLDLVVRLTRGRDARSLYARLAATFAAERQTALAPYLLFAASDLAQHELGDAATALARDDDLVASYPSSGLWDDALWNAVALSRRLGDAEGAIRRCRLLLATRRPTHIVGSFESDYLDDAAAAIGDIYRDDEKDMVHAVIAYDRMLDDFPDSPLRPVVLLHEAEAYAIAGDRAHACATIDRLASAYPGEHVANVDGATLRRELACSAGAAQR